VVDFDELINRIKATSWTWFVGKLRRNYYYSFNWCGNPLTCLQSGYACL